MSLRDLSEKLLDRIRSIGLLNGEEPEAKPNLANGGFTGYRPGRRDPYGTQSLQIGSTTRDSQSNATPSARSGWTGQRQITGRSTGYQQNGWSGENQMQQGGNYWQTPQQPQMMNSWPGQQPAQGQGWQNEGQSRNQADTPWEQPTPANQGGLVYMNAPFADATGRGYIHTERVVQLSSVAACFRVIEFMRNKESVIVNTEGLAGDTDIQRCLDMLAGAAFTLECSMTKITGVKRAYLIAPNTVMVLQDNAIARLSEYHSEEDQLRTGSLDAQGYRPRESQGFGRRARYS